MNPLALAQLDRELAEFWKTIEVRCGMIAAYGSWKPGRRNEPPSGKARAQFNARRHTIFQDFFEPREPQFLRLLTKIARHNDGELTETATMIWQQCRINVGDVQDLNGRPVVPDFSVTRNAKPNPTQPHLMAHLKLTDQVADILRRSTFHPTHIVLPEQLPPAVYKEVDKALKNCGGKWKRGTGHIFATGTQFLTEALQTGVAKDRVKEFQFFPTPAALASDMAALAHIREGTRVLEPSAGDGALIRAIMKYHPEEIYAVEIRSEAYNQLTGMQLDPARSTSQLRCHCGDFLTLTPRDIGLFDAIVMNPPFTKDQDLAHITHAWQFLKPGGRLIALSSPGWTYSLNRKRSAFAEFVQTSEGEYHRQAAMPFGRTEIETVLIHLEKPAMSRRDHLLAHLAAV